MSDEQAWAPGMVLSTQEIACVLAGVDALRTRFEQIYRLADSIWVDNVTGAADASDPTPVNAERIMRLCKEALGDYRVTIG